MVTNRDALVMDLLEGKNSLLPAIKRVSAASQGLGINNIFSKDFSKAQGKLNSFRDVLKQTGVDFAEVMSPQKILKKVSGQPTRMQLFGGVTEDAKQMKMIQSMGQTMGDLKFQGMDVNTMMRDVTLSLGTGTQEMKIFNKAMDAGAKKSKEMANRFDMNTLSWMFGGMALQRVSLMMTRLFIPSMQKLTELNNTASKKVMGVVAAFEFLKVSMFETLSSLPMFQKFIELLVKGAIWAAEFGQQHPRIVGIALAVAGIGTVLGTLAIGVGIFKQLEHLGKLIGVGPGGKVLKNSGMIGGLNKMKSLLGKLGGGLVLGFGIKLAFDDLADDQFDLFDNVLNAAMVGIGLELLGKGWALKGGIWTFIVITAIEIALDPGGFGGFLVNVINWAGRTLDALGETLRWFEDSVSALFSRIFLGKDITIPFPQQLKDWGKEYNDGIIKQVEKLKSEGKVSSLLEFIFPGTLGGAGGSGGLENSLMSTEKLFNENLPTSVANFEDSLMSLPMSITNFENSLMSLPKTMTNFDDSIISTKTLLGEDLPESMTNFGEVFSSTMGTESDAGTAIGKMNLFAGEIDLAQGAFITLKESIDAWDPPDKHINIIYHHIGRDGGPDENVGSVTT